MDIDEILNELQGAIQTLEDEKTTLTELQEDMRQLIASVNALFDLHDLDLPEAPNGES